MWQNLYFLVASDSTAGSTQTDFVALSSNCFKKSLLGTVRTNMYWYLFSLFRGIKLVVLLYKHGAFNKFEQPRIACSHFPRIRGCRDLDLIES